ncbi:hypothetical protein [Desulfotalea psychrophila]|uniref:Helix-turn-helix domain-containing protein n=1 Tax=Desulfotalea psychrophila (strain LSv54 / DSM 12343) TaxID=177439 RepID=Q6AMW8_DESPS|nr:hypothetical protein [Desulfotalea psychrophila]CAG36306.1 unknown protein [Desulfotalea psychrophila LSv54]
MKKNGTILVGMDQITAYAGRNKETIRQAIVSRGFPAVKVRGRWESNSQLIEEWQRKQIVAGCGVTQR